MTMFELAVGRIPLAGVRVHGQRGVGFPMAGQVLDRVPDVAVVLDPLSDAVELKVGAETEVAVALADVPVSATMRTFTARLRVADTGVAPAPQSMTVAITPGGAAKTQFQVEVAGSRRPRGLELKLAGGDVFWTQAAALVEDEYQLPDFAAAVNAYLDRLAERERTVMLRFLVTSQGHGRVAIRQLRFTYSLVQTQVWINELDGSPRVDRSLTLDFGRIEALPLTPIAPPAGKQVVLERVTLDVGGESGPERLIGDPDAPPGGEFATVSGEYFVAQPIVPAAALRCAGVSVYLAAESEGRVYVEVQPDASRRPAVGSPLAKSEAALAPSGGPPQGRWTYVALEAPVDLPPRALFWVVFRGIEGSARVALEPPATTDLLVLHVSRGGQVWKPLAAPGAGRTAAALRLINVPGPENRTAALSLSLRVGEREVAMQRFDPETAPRPLTFEISPPPPTGAVHLIVRSHARGRLTVANVMQEYQAT